MIERLSFLGTTQPFSFVLATVQVRFLKVDLSLSVERIRDVVKGVMSVV